MHELFIYWKLRRDDLAAAQEALHRLQAGLAQAWPGTEARLYLRTDEHAAEATLMETYARAGGIGAELQRDIVARGAEAAAPWCKGARHVEVFVPLRR